MEFKQGINLETPLYLIIVFFVQISVIRCARFYNTLDYSYRKNEGLRYFQHLIASNNSNNEPQANDTFSVVFNQNQCQVYQSYKQNTILFILLLQLVVHTRDLRIQLFTPFDHTLNIVEKMFQDPDQKSQPVLKITINNQKHESVTFLEKNQNHSFQLFQRVIFALKRPQLDDLLEFIRFKEAEMTQEQYFEYMSLKKQGASM